jgi:hypothetical protein
VVIWVVPEQMYHSNSTIVGSKNTEKPIKNRKWKKIKENIDMEKKYYRVLRYKNFCRRDDYHRSRWNCTNLEDNT